MNKKKYEGLPNDLKRVLDANSGRNIAKAAGELWVKIEEPGRKVIASKKKKKSKEFLKFFSKYMTFESVDVAPRRSPPQFHTKPLRLVIMLDGSEKGKANTIPVKRIPNILVPL
jgi:hypothetical protein